MAVPDTLSRRARRKIACLLSDASYIFRVSSAYGVGAGYLAFKERRASRALPWRRLHAALVDLLNEMGVRVQEIREPEECARVVHTQRPSGRLITLQALYTYARYFGNFSASYCLRRLLLEQHVEQQSEMRKLTRDGVNAALELDRAELALRWTSQKIVDRADANYANDVRAFARALGRDASGSARIWEQRYQERDWKFRSLIEGKSVAIVGPAPPDSGCGQEIDGFDYVVRTNYRIGSNDPVSDFGSRTDIAYYNHYRIATQQADVRNASRLVPWVVLKSGADLARFQEFAPDHTGDARNAFLIHDLFFQDAAPMAIQTILGDLLRFAPGRIKLFCTTFYNSANTYNAGYRAIPLTADTTSRDLRLHEPFSCFAFVQNLYRSGLCEVDETTARVIKATPSIYAECLQSLYGAYCLE